MQHLVLFQTSGPWFTSSTFEALGIQAVFKCIAKGNVRERVDRLSEEFTEEKLSATLQQILALAVGTPLVLYTSEISLLCLPQTYK